MKAETLFVEEKKSNEKPEILDLIEKSKAGDDDAYNKLYKQYEDLLHGKYIKRFISSSIDFIEHDDINSIMNLIFVESLNTYDPSRAKFITHLTRQIHFRFTGHYLKERMMPFSNNASKEKIITKLNKTRCILTDNIGAMLSKTSQSSIILDPTLVAIEFNGQETDVPLGVLFTSIIPSIVEKMEDKRASEIFLYYIELMLNGETSITKSLRKKFNCSVGSIKKALDSTSEVISDNIKIRYILN